MAEPRLKSEIWIKAQLRICDLAMLPCVVARRGDADAGQVLVKIYGEGRKCRLLARRYSDDGKRVWQVISDGDEAEVDVYISREAGTDPDLWVLEIEDPKDVYRPDGQELIIPNHP